MTRPARAARHSRPLDRSTSDQDREYYCLAFHKRDATLASLINGILQRNEQRITDMLSARVRKLEEMHRAGTR
jgi:hypothetical protein